MGSEKLFSRIEKLFDVGLLADARVLVLGCGSGGGSLSLQLVMSGIRNLTLIDNDMLEPENIIRHVCDSRFIGRRKVDALEEVLLARNDSISIRKHDIDIMRFDGLESEVNNHTVIALATDNEPTRYLVNEICVRNRIPFVVGRVFTRGIGGEVFAYRPRVSGCLACLEKVLERTQFRSGVKEVDLLSEVERERVYGLEIAEIRDSPGLNVDISFITAFHSRFVLDAIAASLPERPKYMEPIPENYIVWGNRPTQPFTKHFQLQRITLHPQEGCLICSNERE